MDTKLTIDEIELAIVNSGLFNKRNDIIVPNISWGLLNHEADMVVKVLVTQKGLDFIAKLFEVVKPTKQLAKIM